MLRPRSTSPIRQLELVAHNEGRLSYLSLNLVPESAQTFNANVPAAVIVRCEVNRAATVSQ